MTKARFTYQAKQVDQITVRPFNFEFPDDLDPHWIPGQKVRGHFFNGMSLTMPYLEPFLVKTMREASGLIDELQLKEDIKGFNGQEANHYKCHRRLNTLLRQNGYPEFAEVESRLDRSYKKLQAEDLEKRLAYSAGFECMTNGFTTWLINKRKQLFGGADPHVTSFWLMHMVEETEHKTVAFDAYMAYSGRYLPRAIGVFHGSLDVLYFGVNGMFQALRKDGELGKPQCWMELARELGGLLWNVGPFLLRALSPRHNPRGEDDPKWMLDWTVGHAGLADGAALPLIDTNHPDMPVPFASTKC